MFVLLGQLYYHQLCNSQKGASAGLNAMILIKSDPLLLHILSILLQQ